MQLTSPLAAAAALLVEAALSLELARGLRSGGGLAGGGGLAPQDDKTKMIPDGMDPGDWLLALNGNESAMHHLVSQLKPNTTCAPHTVFNVGLPRTGTMSMYAHLLRLGFTSHHMVRTPYKDVLQCRQGKGGCNFYRERGAGKPEGRVYFSDTPTYGLACQLVKQFPGARFILMTRPFESFSSSVHRMLCSFVLEYCPVLQWSQLFQAQSMLFGGRPFPRFCQQAKTHPHLCDGAGHSESAEAAWRETGLPEGWRSIQRTHDDEVRRCVPPGQLLELELGAADTAERVHGFLGCSGEAAGFPRLGMAAAGGGP